MDLVKAALAVGAATGAFVIDDRLSQAVIALVWALTTFAATVSTRARVTPWPGPGSRSSLDRNR
jgi:predicted MFS family arabinose efflux permease